MLVTIIWEKSEGEPALVKARYVPYACSETVIELKRSVHNQFRRPELSVSQSVGRSATANRTRTGTGYEIVRKKENHIRQS